MGTQNDQGLGHGPGHADAPARAPHVVRSLMKGHGSLCRPFPSRPRHCCDAASSAVTSMNCENSTNSPREITPSPFVSKRFAKRSQCSYVTPTTSASARSSTIG